MEEDDHAGWMQELGPRDAALVRAFRTAAVALGRGCDEHGARARAELATLTAPGEHRDTVEHFWALMTTIGSRAQRQIRFHVPDCPCLGDDEAAFLRLCAHLRSGERVRAQRHAALLVPHDATDRLLHHAAVIARRCRSGTAPSSAMADSRGAVRLH